MSDAPNTPKPAKLTLKQRAFIEHYFAQGDGQFNASEAARLAGFSKKTAGQQGYQLLQKPSIQAAIAARLEELKVGADEVLLRIAAQARGTLAPFLRVSPAGDLTGFDFSDGQPLHLLRKASVRERTIKNVTERTTTIELYDSQAALFKLGEHHGLWKSRMEIDATIIERISAAADETERKLARLAGAGSGDSVPPQSDAR